MLVCQVPDASSDRLLMNAVERGNWRLRQLLDIFPELHKLLCIESVEGLVDLGFGGN